MNDIKLKPCPFCGGMNLYYAAGRFYSAECGDCGGKVVGAYRTEEEAAEAWNTRKEQSQELMLKEHVCSVIEILDRMRKDINPYERTDISLRITLNAVDNMGIGIDTSCAKNSWFSPDAASIDKFKTFDISEKRIVKYLGEQVKPPKQRIEEEIAENERELADLIEDKASRIETLKAKLVMLGERKD